VGFAPSFSSHVSGFPARGATNACVCGFHQGKPHEVCQRQQAQQEIRSTLGRTLGTRPGSNIPTQSATGAADQLEQSAAVAIRLLG
jgi:hypothetical protein